MVHHVSSLFLPVHVFFVHSGYCTQITAFCLPAVMPAWLQHLTEVYIHAKHCEKWLTKLLLSAHGRGMLVHLLRSQTLHFLWEARSNKKVCPSSEESNLAFPLRGSIEEESLSIFWGVMLYCISILNCSEQILFRAYRQTAWQTWHYGDRGLAPHTNS